MKSVSLALNVCMLEDNGNDKIKIDQGVQRHHKVHYRYFRLHRHSIIST